MSSAANVIARKVSSARVSRSPIPRVEEIGEDFAKLLDERLRRILRTVTSSIILSCEVKKLPRVLETIPVPAMLGVVTVKNAPASALVNISNDLIYHVVDIRMGGDSEMSPVPTARSITALDGMLCRDFVEAVLGAFSAAVSMNLRGPALDWMKLRAFEQHVSMARIAPENADVLVLSVSLDIGAAARSGDFDFVIPLSVLDAFKAAASRAQDKARPPDEGDLWAQRMLQAAREAPVQLMALVHRMQLGLGEVQSWAEGDVIPLHPQARSRVEIVIRSREDQPLATGRLGAVEDRKAVKLAMAPDPELVAHLTSLTGKQTGERAGGRSET